MTGLAKKSEESVDARGAPRRRTLRGATLVHADGAMTIECVIRDRSEGGAKLEVPPMAILPRQMWLLDHSAPIAYEAQLLWRKQNLAGVAWLSSRDLDAPSDKSLQTLKRIWVEKAPRPGEL